MTTPRVNEIPLSLEATTRDPFADDVDAQQPAAEAEPQIEWQLGVPGRPADC